MEELRRFSDDELLHGYLTEAAWFWFDASTGEKKLEVGLHRLAARCIYEEIRRRGLDEPSPQRLHAHARRLFPPDDFLARHVWDYPRLLDSSPGPGW
jgi:hypothetical protein